MATTLDGNTWYHVTISNPPAGRTLALFAAEPESVGGQLALVDYGASLQHESWQFLRDTTVTNGTYYVLRPKSQDPSWYVATETDSSNNTVPLLGQNGWAPAGRWAWDPWGDGSFKLSTELGGEELLLEVQDPANPNALVMDSRANDTGKHWLAEVLTSIDNAKYSSLPPTFPSATTATAGSSSPTLNSSSTPAASGSGGLSTGAIAGIGVGVGIAVLSALLVAVVVYRRRRKQRRARPPVGRELVQEPQLDDWEGKPRELDTVAPKIELHETAVAELHAYSAPTELRGQG